MKKGICSFAMFKRDENCGNVIEVTEPNNADGFLSNKIHPL